MPHCIVPNKTTEEIKDALLNKNIKDIMATEDLMERSKIMRKTNKMVSTQEVDAMLLPPKLRNELNLKEGDKIQRYVLDDHLLNRRRTTDPQTADFIKSLGKAKAAETSNMADNVIKAEEGTKLHRGAELLMTRLIEMNKGKDVVSLSELDGEQVETVSDAEISEITGLKGKNLERFIEGINKLFDLIVDRQKKIDPNSRAIILPEQFVMDPIRDIGSTIDIGGFFSDGTHINLDYKSMMPRRNDVNIKNEIENPDWIPFYREEGIFDQLSTINHTMETFYGSEGASLSRGVPVHVRFKDSGKAKKGEELVNTITHLSIGEGQDAMLEHIPVEEMVILDNKDTQEKINKNIGVLTRIINNREQRLKELKFGTSEYTTLLSRIKNNRKALNKLILKQDSSLLREGFNSLLNKIAKDGRILKSKNIDDVEINGKPNPDYMSTEELRELSREVEAFKNVIESTGYYQEELNLTNDTQAYEDYLKGVDRLAGNARRLTEEIRNVVRNRELTPSEQKAFDDVAEGSWFNNMARTLGEQVSIPFRKLRTHLDNAQNKRRIDSQNLYNRIKEENKKLEENARKLGMSITQAFEMMINPNTENLWGEHSKEFYADLEKAQNNKNSNWINKHLELKSDAFKIYEENLSIFERTRYKPSDKEKNFWKKENHPDSAKFGKKWWLYYDIKEELPEKYYSEGFREIRKHDFLLNYYKFYTDTMKEMLDRLGFRGDEKLPRNFLPFIRQDILGTVAQGTFDLGQIREAFESLMNVREDDTGLGDMTTADKSDPITGKPKHNIPRYFTNPIRDSKGKIKRGMKLTDLSKSLQIFGEMAYNYEYMKNEVEPHVEAIRDVMIEKGMQEISAKGRKKKLKSGLWAKIRGEDISVVKLYDKYVNYHLYGLKIQDVDRKWVKRIQNLKTFQTLKELALSPLLWVGNKVQITGNAFFEGHAGYFYTKKQLVETMREGTGALNVRKRNKYAALAYLFEFSPTTAKVKQKDMSRRWIERWLNTDTLFFGMRKAEQAVNNNIGVATMKNHTLVDGNVVRLENAPEGAKSIYDMGEFNSEGYFEIEGITDSRGNVTDFEAYRQIRNLGLAVASRVKGQMNPEDLSAVYMGIATNAAMGFKTWMPGMFDARFTSLRYNPATNSMVMGKYTALATEMSREDRSFINWLGNVVMPTMAKFTANMATFGAYNFVAGQFGEQFKSKVNEQRAKRLFEQYKERFKHDDAIQKMKFEDFVKYKQGQLKSLSAELAAILAVVSMIMALRADWDDDGEAAWRKNLYSRTLFRALNRGRRELAFFISPEDWSYMFRMPIPIMSLPIDAERALSQGLDGVGDIVKGEEPVTDRGKHKFYELFKFTPGHKLIQMLEAGEFDDLREI